MILAAAVALSLLAAVPSAQAPRPIPRTIDGHPDLHGTYDIASMTPLERAPGTPLVMTKEEAADVLKSLTSGMPFDEAIEKYSQVKTAPGASWGA